LFLSTARDRREKSQLTSIGNQSRRICHFLITGDAYSTTFSEGLCPYATALTKKLSNLTSGF
jgi:predicted RNA-binding protein Jag